MARNVGCPSEEDGSILELGQCRGSVEGCCSASEVLDRGDYGTIGFDPHVEEVCSWVVGFPSDPDCSVAGLECGWEVLENTSFIIERYRAETISLNYFGDSIVNSLGDILACIAGVLLASRLPTRVAVIGVVVIEVLLVIWTRDNLTLNIIMLVHPSHVIRAWQLAR